MRSVADLVTGPLYDYLGHFRNPKWLALGHNDLDASGKLNDANDQNTFVEQNAAANAPGVAGMYTASTVTGNPL